jgi:hypothetical protein
LAKAEAARRDEEKSDEPPASQMAMF